MEQQEKAKKILVIQHDWSDPLGLLEQLLATHELTYDIVHLENDPSEPLPSPTNYAAVVALGGSQHVYDEQDYALLRQEERWLHQVVEQDVPYLGICLGCQLLANAFGGHVRLHSLTEIGFFDVQLTEQGKQDPLFAGFEQHQKVFHWHEDTFELPVGAVRLTTTAKTQNQAFRYGRRAYGLQYHIELDPEILNTWLYHPSMKESIIAVIGFEAYQTIESERESLFPLYQQHTTLLFENFLRISKLLN